ncbi:MAG: hypothetical protein AAF581_21695 [Planctomycetota bacterium]
MNLAEITTDPRSCRFSGTFTRNLFGRSYLLALLCVGLLPTLALAQPEGATIPGRGLEGVEDGTKPADGDGEAAPEAVRVREVPVIEVVDALERVAGRAVSFPTFRAEGHVVRILGDLPVDSYLLLKALLDAHGYVVVEDLRAGIVRIRNTHTRVREIEQPKQRKKKPEAEKQNDRGTLVSAVCPLTHLDVEATFDMTRMLLRSRQRAIGDVTKPKVEMVLPERSIVISGRLPLVMRVQKLLRWVDTPFGDVHPVFRSFSLHNIGVVEMTKRIEELLGIPYQILVVDEESSELRTSSSPGIEKLDPNQEYTRILGLPGAGKIVVESNNIKTLELTTHLVVLLNKEDPYLRSSTFAYQGTHTLVESLEKRLRQFIWEGGLPERDLDEAKKSGLFPTRIIAHAPSNTLLIQTPPWKFEHMLAFLQKIDTPQ